MEYFDQWNNRPPLRQEPGGGPVLVDTTGYVPIDIRVRAMEAAGQRLAQAYGIYQWGPDEEPDEDAIPVGVIDRAEASQYLTTARRQLYELARMAKKQLEPKPETKPEPKPGPKEEPPKEAEK